jgi:hypothetical protein
MQDQMFTDDQVDDHITGIATSKPNSVGRGRNGSTVDVTSTTPTRVDDCGGGPGRVPHDND